MIQDAIVTWGIPVIFIFMISNGFLSTPPSEIVLSVAGALTVGNQISFMLMLSLVVTANYIGTCALYWIGRVKGEAIIDYIRNIRLLNKVPFIKDYIPNADTVAALMIWFNEKGAWLILVCRMLPFIRSIISIPAGISKVHFAKFSILSLIGIIIWDFAWLCGGFFMGQAIIDGNYIIITILAVVLLVILYLVGRQVRTFLSEYEKQI